jgi:iron complex transport system ATP-binding protein
MKEDPEEILSINSLEIGYSSGNTNKVLLPPLTACAKTGELIAVIGRNGIGKSTLLRTLTGLQKPLGGNICYEGRNIGEYTRMELALKVGYISTEIVRVSNMSVYDLVALGRFPYTNWFGKIGTADHERILDAISKTAMDSFCAKFVSELSDGERQKAMIARILAQDTGIMVMDEPTAFLDISAKYEILHLLHNLSEESNKTIIFSTHDLQMAISQSDKIWLILDDKLIEGAPEDLMISGAFDNLFSSTNVSFNTEDGTFSFRSETLGSVYIEGNDMSRYWTEKAVNRAGFTIAKEKTETYITLPSENGRLWLLKKQLKTEEYRSIYDLIKSLKQIL